MTWPALVTVIYTIYPHFSAAVGLILSNTAPWYYLRNDTVVGGAPQQREKASGRLLLTHASHSKQLIDDQLAVDVQIVKDVVASGRVTAAAGGGARCLGHVAPSDLLDPPAFPDCQLVDSAT